MAFGPPGEFGHTLEAGLFVKVRRLEVVRRDPHAPRASSGRLGDKSIKQLPAMADTSAGFLDPHQFEFGDPRPGITGGDADRVSGIVPQCKDEAAVVTAACAKPVITVETLFDGVEVGPRKIVLGLQARGHQMPPYQS